MLPNPVKVLVISIDNHDAPYIQTLVQGIQGRGFSLMHATSLDEGLNVFDSGGCDICLLDASNNKETGVPTQPAAAAMIDRINRRMFLGLPSIPLLILGEDEPFDCDKYRSPGFAEFDTPIRLDRSACTAYTLERTLCFALERNRLQERIGQLRTQDSLTGLLTRQEFDRFLASELVRCRRYHYPISLMALQVEGYDSIVADYGQSTADQMLRWAANIIIENIRTVDRVARYTSSEFVALLPETNADTAAIVGRRLIHRISKGPFVLFPYNSPVVEFMVRAFIGIVEGPTYSDYPSVLASFAESALRQAQAEKRSRIAIYSAGG